jgi:hypothetical protein
MRNPPVGVLFVVAGGAGGGAARGGLATPAGFAGFFFLGMTDSRDRTGA